MRRVDASYAASSAQLLPLSRASERERVGTHRGSDGEGEGLAVTVLGGPSPGDLRYASIATLSRFEARERETVRAVREWEGDAGQASIFAMLA
jgi:hypothetical protein